MLLHGTEIMLLTNMIWNFLTQLVQLVMIILIQASLLSSPVRVMIQDKLLLIL